MKYINAYAISRNYGGPEEGGWWYDSGRVLASVPWPDDTSEAQLNSSKTWLRSLLQPEVAPHRLETVDRFSVCGDGEDLSIRIEDGPAEAYPTETPYFC
jgi:hypothetical protein